MHENLELYRKRLIRECEERVRAAPHRATEWNAHRERLAAPEAVVTFAGRFKVGKSTVINAALGRPLLPVFDQPETGTVCVLRAGPRDAAVIHEAGGRRELPCTTDAIREEVALLDERGKRRTLEGQSRLEIQLGGGLMCPIPTGARWVDSPGFDDTDQMNARAQAAVNETDLLFWILNTSTSPLSEGDVERLGEYTARFGESGVTLVFNVRLADDTIANWQQFERRNKPRLLQRVRERQEEMGFTRPPRVIFVSARAVGGDGNRSKNPLLTMANYGGSELWSILKQVHSGAHPLVQVARLERWERSLQAPEPGITDGRSQRPD